MRTAVLTLSGLASLAAVGTGFSVLLKGLELMGYSGPGLGACLVFGGLAFLAVTILAAPQLKDWRFETSDKVLRRVYGAVAVGVVLVPTLLYAFAPAPPAHSAEGPAPPPARPKYRGVVTLEAWTSPDADVLKEQFDLDGAGTLLIQPPFDTTQVTLALSKGRQLRQVPNGVVDGASITQPHTLTLGGGSQMFIADQRVFLVWLETATDEARAPERANHFRYQLRVAEQ